MCCSRKPCGKLQLDHVKYGLNNDEVTIFCDDAVRRSNATIMHCYKLQHTLKNLFGHGHNYSSRTGIQCATFTSSQATRCTNIVKLNPPRGLLNHIEIKQQELKTAMLPDAVSDTEDGSSSIANGHTHTQKKRKHGVISIDEFETAKEYSQSCGLSESQTLVVNRTFDHFKAVKTYQSHSKTHVQSVWHLHNNKITPLHFVMTGDPGSGKSHVIETVAELVTVLKMETVGATSHNGIAAVNMDGSTVCRGHKIGRGVSVTLSHDHIKKFQFNLDTENICIVIIDVVATIDSKIIALTNHCLRQELAANLLFCGLPLLFVGEFNQLGLVKKVFLPKDMIKWSKRKQKPKQYVKDNQLPDSNIGVHHIEGPQDQPELTTPKRLIQSRGVMKTMSRKSKKIKKRKKG